MELLSMKYWNLFFNDTESVTRAKRKQLHGVVTVLPWVAAIDKFQHEVYTLPGMTTPENRHDLWNRIYTEFSSSVIDWSGLDDIKRTLWQRQLHPFEVPFYYIEYGFSQLGAVAVWKNANTNFEKAIQDYKNALSLGYTKTVPEIYKTAGIEFNFSTSYIEQLINFVKSQLETL
jgi:oligoendopeptidase F